MQTTPRIPERFYKTITLHILKNLIEIDGYKPPLILGIHGAPGEGKTFMCEQTLRSIGVKSFLISGGQLESENAGEPAALLRSVYKKAGGEMLKGKTLASAILINDFDTGVGNWGKLVQFTINTQQLFAELMHLTDYPEIVENETTPRVPIIITGNNFESLHLPLLRTGRMWLYEWKPEFQEKVNVVERIFSELDKKEIAMLVSRFDKQPISFFSHAKNTLIDSTIWAHLSLTNPANVIRELRTVNSNFLVSLPRYTLKDAMDSCDGLLSSSSLINHIST